MVVVSGIPALLAIAKIQNTKYRNLLRFYNKRQYKNETDENEAGWDGGIEDSQCLHLHFPNNLNCSTRASLARTILQLYVKLFDTDCVFEANE